MYQKSQCVSSKVKKYCLLISDFSHGLLKYFYFEQDLKYTGFNDVEKEKDLYFFGQQ